MLVLIHGPERVSSNASQGAGNGVARRRSGACARRLRLAQIAEYDPACGRLPFDAGQPLVAFLERLVEQRGERARARASGFERGRERRVVGVPGRGRHRLDAPALLSGDIPCSISAAIISFALSLIRTMALACIASPVEQLARAPTTVSPSSMVLTCNGDEHGPRHEMTVTAAALADYPEEMGERDDDVVA